MKSIQTRVTVGLLLGSFLVLGASGGIFYLSARSILLREFDGTLKTKALTLAALTQWENQRIELEPSPELAAEFSRKDHPAYFELWLADTSTLARSDSMGESHLPRRFGSMKLPQFWNLPLPGGETGRAIGLQFSPETDETNQGHSSVPNPNPILTLVVARSLSDVTRTLAAFQSVLLVVGMAALVTLIILIRLVIGRGLAPLAYVAERTAVIDASSLRQRFPTDLMPAELLPICQRLNELLARLEQSFERERQFTADAAHELRTPIAELRSLAEVALKWPEGPEEATVAFADALEISHKMEAIVNGLLALARCEAGKQPIQKEAVIIAELVEDLWRPLADKAADRKLRVVFEIAQDIDFETDRALFGVVLANLLSNAVEYTPSGGTIRVHCAQLARCVTLTVSNSVNNLSPADLPHLFERFWRKDAARSVPEHAGLGLSLARAFAELLGFTIHADMADASTLVLTLRGTEINQPSPSTARCASV